MATISSNIGDVSTYGNRMVTITVTGLNQQSAHVAHQQMSVSYNRLSQTMQNIHRSGGKVVAVSMGGANSVVVAVPTAAASKNNEPAKQPEKNPSSNKKKR
jgi:CpcD/allophycocyanin linker domain